MNSILKEPINLGANVKDQSEVPSGVLPDEESRRWFVIKTKLRQESVCLEELTRNGFEGLCPMTLDYRWRRRRNETVPLFPGYVFSRCRFPEDYHRVRWLRGVLHLVRFGEAPPPPIEESVMRYFLENMDESGVIKTGSDFEIGDRVEFLTEPMRGLVGTVLRIDSAEKRVQVLMDLLYQATVEVESYQVQAR